MTVTENINIAFTSIKGNMTRATITALIISIGIMALVGILTAIDGMKSSINANFSNMGANTFNIKNRGKNIHYGGRKAPQKRYRPITKLEAQHFAESYKFPSKASVSYNASFTSTVKYENHKTDPNVMVMGGDVNYLEVASFEVEYGRNFSEKDVATAANVCIIGKEVRAKIFKNKFPVGESVHVGGAKYRVVGVLKSKGSAMGFGGDRLVIVPLTNAYQVFSKPNASNVITVAVTDMKQLDFAVDEATSVFRKVRKLPATAENNFEVYKAENIAEELLSNLRYVTVAATIIGFITLVGAAVGLMNIMLVSVTERTREIGIRKAIGATQKVIRRQFLVEAIVICQIGGMGGIVLGLIIGNIVSMLVGGGFIIPWLWIAGGISLCVVVGLTSGIYPAIKASKLDPIEALRFE